MMNESSCILALYGISVIKQTKSYSLIKLKGSDKEIKVTSGLFNLLVEAYSNNEIHTIKLPKIRLGIELEFLGFHQMSHVAKFNKHMADLLGEFYEYRSKYTHNLNGITWLLGIDNSIKSDDPTYTGYELSTAIIDVNNEKDIELLKKVINLIKEDFGGFTNSTCGTHIHLGFNFESIRVCDIQQLLSFYSSLEKRVFDPLVPSNRRNNKYCRPTKIKLTNKYQKLSTRYCQYEPPVNICSLCKDIHLEFRELEGTLELDEILLWSYLHMLIVYDFFLKKDSTAYLDNLQSKSIIDLMVYYGLSPLQINQILNRVIKYKSRSLYNNMPN